MKYLLGIDFGGGASKATLLGENGVIVATATVEYPTAYPKQGFAEQTHQIGIMPLKPILHLFLKKAEFHPPTYRQSVLMPQHIPPCFWTRALMFCVLLYTGLTAEALQRLHTLKKSIMTLS